MQKIEQSNVTDFWTLNPCSLEFSKAKLGTKAYFDDVDSYRYEAEGHILGQLDTLPLAGNTVLEIGLGSGSDSEQLARRAKDYIGVDPTQTACELVKKRFEVRNLQGKVIQASATRIPLEDASVDLVYSHGVIHHIPEVNQVINEIYRVLKPNGTLVLMVYAKNSLNLLHILTVRRFALLCYSLLPAILRNLIPNPFYQKLEGQRKLLAEKGAKFLTFDPFVSANTDGPSNPYSKVYSAQEMKHLLQGFQIQKNEKHYLGVKNFPLLRRLLPKSLELRLSKSLGWHLWTVAKKTVL